MSDENKISKNQPLLHKITTLISKKFGQDVIVSAEINPLANDMPIFAVSRNSYFKIAKFLKQHDELSFDYLVNLHGTDFETHMEIFLQLRSLNNDFEIAIKVCVDRENPTVPSVESIWPAANWAESETYDLLGIHFALHPNLERIFLGENWVGYPLRKDYQPYDEEVL